MTPPDEQLTTALRERGQRVTTQRLVLHRLLRRLDRHVSAEELARAAERDLPGLSLPTVYATLDLFEELGVVKRVSQAGGPTLYDPRAEPHHHLRCSRCGRLEDLDSPIDTKAALRAAKRAGYTPERAEITVVGLCSRCSVR